MRMRNILLIVLCLGLIVSVAPGDTLTMKDGTKVEGRVIPQGERDWVKLPDGSTKYIDKDKVAGLTKGDSPTAPSTPAGATSKPATPGATATFASVKSKAELVDTPLLAVQMWQKFIDAKPSAPDLAQANAELSKWQKLSDSGAEKINGKWIGGGVKKQT